VPTQINNRGLEIWWTNGLGGLSPFAMPMLPLNINFRGGDCFIKDSLSRVGCTKSTLVIQYVHCMTRMRHFNMFFGNIRMPEFFGAWFQAEFHSFYHSALIEGIPHGEHLDGQGHMQISLAFSLFGCNRFSMKTTL
jgi:hypothetical protein